MPIHSDAYIIRIISDIRKLRDAKKTDNEIMGILNIPLRSYRRYLHKIYTDDKTEWQRIARTQLEPELMRLKKSLEHTYERAKALSDDKEYNYILEALETKDSARASIVKLLVEGPQYIKQVEDLINEDKQEGEVQPKSNRDIQEQTTSKG